MRKILLNAFIMLTSVSVLAQNSAKVDELLQQLSLEQKVQLVVGTGMDIPEMGGTVVGKTEKKVPGAAGTSFAIPSLRIPEIVMADGPAGVRIDPKRNNEPGKTFYATAFPVASLMASSFNTQMEEQIGKAFGNECKEYGVDILLAPGMNIHRNPLGGRNFEYFSEDPIVAGKMAAAFTRGVQSQGIGVSIKHFAANNQETNRPQINTIISERALREIYLKGFEIAVKEANPWTVMSSYNKINDVYTSESKDLLTTILRDEWGFKGFVMTDWFGGRNPITQMQAGNDLLMPGTKQQQDTILKAIKAGNLKLEELDRNVARILTIYLKTQSYNGYKPSGNPQLEKNRQTSREAAGEGMVLLKNEKNSLPLNLDEKIALFGIGSYMTISGGTGSGDVNKEYMVSINEGIEKAGFKLNQTTDAVYKKYIADQKANQKPKKMFFLPDEVFGEINFSAEELDSIAKQSSVGVFTITRTSGEFMDRKLENDFNLKNSEIESIKMLSEAFHRHNKHLIVLLNIGGVIETASWKDLVDAILLVWQPGQEGGHTVADILSGKVNPSGKLPMTFSIKYTDVYASKNFPGRQLDPNQQPNMFTGVPSEVIYEEDIFVGYRYFDTYQIPTSFPFGFGLSYTTFSESDYKVEKLANDQVKVSCKVKNTGKIAGKEVVMIYVSAPEGKLTKPAKELKAFAKSNLLKPGEEQKFEFTLSNYDISYYNAESSAWITDKGMYKVKINNMLAGSFNLEKDKEVLKTNKALIPTRKINILE